MLVTLGPGCDSAVQGDSPTAIQGEQVLDAGPAPRRDDADPRATDSAVTPSGAATAGENDCIERYVRLADVLDQGVSRVPTP